MTVRNHTTRTEANARLTSLAGLVLFVLLAVEGVTIVRVHWLVTAHIVVGLILLGPLAIKLGSTAWRFVRYYRRDPEYRQAGPPHPLLRVLAPSLVFTSLAVFASGITLVTLKPGPGSTLLLIHKLSFIVWFGVTTVHVVAYFGPALRRSWADVTGAGPVAVLATRRNRVLLIGAGLAAGVAIALFGLGWAHTWVHRLDASGGRGR